MNKRMTPGFAAHAACAVLSLSLVLTMLFTCLTGGLFLAVSDEALMQRAADAALDEQVARVAATVSEQAEEYGFDPMPVLALSGREAAAAYNHELVTWWMALLRDPAELDAPQWSCPSISETVMADAAYQEKTPATQRRTIAVDKVEAAVARTMERTALPLRTSLLHAGLVLVDSRIPVRTAVNVVRMTPVLCLLMSALLVLTMLICMHRDMRRALSYAGAGLLAAAIVTAAMLALVHSQDVLGQAAALSTVFPAQLGVLAGGMGVRIGVLAAVSGAIGAVLLGIHQKIIYRH